MTPWSSYWSGGVWDFLKTEDYTNSQKVYRFLYKQSKRLHTSIQTVRKVTDIYTKSERLKTSIQSERLHTSIQTVRKVTDFYAVRKVTDF